MGIEIPFGDLVWFLVKFHFAWFFSMLALGLLVALPLAFGFFVLAS